MKGMKVWISRDAAFGNEPFVEIWEQKPGVTEGYFGQKTYCASLNGRLTSLCYPYFRRVTGFILQPGEVKQVRFGVKVVK